MNHPTIASTFEHTLSSSTTPFLSDSIAMATIRDVPQSTLNVAASAHVEVIWQMARESLTANDDQIVVNSSIYHIIGNAGLEELKLRLR